MSELLDKLKREADGIRWALDSSGGNMFHALRLGAAECAIRQAVKEIERLEERWRQAQLSWVLRTELDAAANVLAEAQARIADLEHQLAKKQALPQSIQDALNSGDGSYKP